MKFYVAVLACTFSGCVAAPQQQGNAHVFQPIVNHFYPLSDRESALIKKGVDSELRDPAGGIYASLRATKGPDGVVTACGLVNARNGFGGYSGGSPFAGQFRVHADGSRSFVPLHIGGSGPSSSDARTFCAHKSLTI